MATAGYILTPYALMESINSYWGRRIAEVLASQFRAFGVSDDASPAVKKGCNLQIHLVSLKQCPPRQSMDLTFYRHHFVFAGSEK